MSRHPPYKHPPSISTPPPDGKSGRPYMCGCVECQGANGKPHLSCGGASWPALFPFRLSLNVPHDSAADFWGQRQCPHLHQCRVSLCSSRNRFGICTGRTGGMRPRRWRSASDTLACCCCLCHICTTLSTPLYKHPPQFWDPCFGTPRGGAHGRRKLVPGGLEPSHPRTLTSA